MSYYDNSLGVLAAYNLTPYKCDDKHLLRVMGLKCYLFLIKIFSFHFAFMPRICLFCRMLDHPITVVLNVFDTLKNDWLKVYKFMSIQIQEDHISHIKQSKNDRFQDR